MKNKLILLAVSLIALAAISCSVPAEPAGGTVPDYGGYVDALSGDPSCGGYRCAAGGATYTVLQRGGDIRIDFESTADPGMNMSAFRLDGRTVWIRGGEYAEDADGYAIPVSGDLSVVDRLYGELRTYGDFEYSGETTVDGAVCGELRGAKTEDISDPVDFDYDSYDVFFTYEDGKNYRCVYFDCSDKSKNMFSGEVPEDFNGSGDWAADPDEKTVYNRKTGKSYPAAVDLRESHRYDPDAPKQALCEASLFVDRKTGRLNAVRIAVGDYVSDYTMLYPDSIEPIDTEGLSRMDPEEAEYCATMIALMLSTL